MENFVLDVRAMQAHAIDPATVSALLGREVRKAYAKHCDATGNTELAKRLDSVSYLAQREIETVVSRVIMHRFGNRYSELYVPMSNDGVQPWADEAVYQVVTETGLAAWVTTADIPWADVQMTEQRVKVRNMASKVGWTIFEIEAARAGGKPLDVAKLRAQKRAVDSSRDIVMISGDAQLPVNSGLIPTGLINDVTVPTTPALGGAWAGLSSAQIVQAVLAARATYRNNARESQDPTNILLPTSQHQRLMEPLNTNSSVSIREYLINTIPNLQAIDELPALSTAGAGGVARMVMYARDPMVVHGIVPLPFRVMSPEERDLMTSVIAIERQAGCVWEFPPGGLYVDGV